MGFFGLTALRVYSGNVMRRGAFFFSLIALAAMPACAREPTLVGKWKGSLGAPRDSPSVLIEFREDGTSTFSIVWEDGIQLDYYATYSISGNVLTTVSQGSRASGTILDFVPTAEKELEKSIETVQVGSRTTSTLRFSGPDTLHLSSSRGEVLTLTRAD